jgi:RNA polymerase sigma-70 factor (ECF subfamily)
MRQRDEMGRETYSEVPDRGLAEALLERGDEKAFRELYRRHTPRLFQFVLRLLSGAEVDAEDVVQETWLRATQHLGRFRWESSLSTWLSGIGLNVCRDLWRKRNGRDLEWNGSAEPPVLAPRTDERIDLERAITLLPVGYRTVLILHDLEGFTHDEIGEQLGIAAGTSKSQLSCARRAVRAMLNPEPRRMDGRDA